MKEGADGVDEIRAVGAPGGRLQFSEGDMENFVH
jgi:hypothetical protein